MKGSRLHLDLFKVFCDLAWTRSFSKTAAQNYLTQSAVSQQLAFLERHFGRKLVDRGEGRFALTQAGTILAEGGRAVLKTYQEILDRVSQPMDVSGTIRVETVYSLGLYGLALQEKTFLRRYPKTDLHIKFERSDQIYLDVVHEVCDLGIVACPWEHPLVRIIPFTKEKLAVICRPGDPAAAGKKARWRDLQGRDFIAFNRDIPTRKLIDDMLRKHKTVVRIVREFDNIETLKRCVEAGRGISIIPENTVSQEVRRKSLAVRQLAGEPFYRLTGILCRKDRELPAAVKEFIHCLAGAANGS